MINDPKNSYPKAFNSWLNYYESMQTLRNYPIIHTKKDGIFEFYNHFGELIQFTEPYILEQIEKEKQLEEFNKTINKVLNENQ